MPCSLMRQSAVWHSVVMCGVVLFSEVQYSEV